MYLYMLFLIIVLLTITRMSFTQVVLPREDEFILGRSKREVGGDLERVRSLLKGFLKLSADIPLTPQRRSNFASRRINYKIIDRTEYSANLKILDEVFETDLVLTVPQINEIIEDFKNRMGKRNLRRNKRKAIIGDTFRWPNQIIPYFLKEEDADWRKLIRGGMKKWEKETCIRFKERSDEKDYVYVFKGAGCYSSVGRIGGRQYTSIGYGCGSDGIVAHEFGHTIGFWHEQSRPDRDRYINVNEDHLIKGTKGNFEKRNDIADLKTSYDFGSVMHYGPQAFTNDYNFVTIETKDHRFQHTIGQRKDLSFIDIKEANALYCKDRCRIKLSCLHGGYENPRNCAVCKCPPGMAGARCESIPPSHHGCGGELIASTIWQTLYNDIVGQCYWRITAPAGKIRLEVLDASYVCDSSCPENYLEIKHTINVEQTGFRQCCNGAPGVIISEGREIFVMSISTKRPSNFTLRFIEETESGMIPKPPPGQWNGGGLTALIGAENGIDNTWEQFILKQLPGVLRNIGRPAKNPNPWSSIGDVVQRFLKQGK